MQPLPLGLRYKFGSMRIGHPDPQLFHSAIPLLTPVALELCQSIFASLGTGHGHSPWVARDHIMEIALHPDGGS